MKKKVLISWLISILFLISLTDVFALDLSNYPIPFVINGVYDNSNVFVVGSTAPPSDSIAVADITSGLQFESKECVIVDGEEQCIVVEITPVTKLDTEIAGSESSYNLVLVGSPCVNKAIGRVSGTGITCENWALISGQCIIKLAPNGDKVALVVAGYSADDTRMCGKVILNYKDYTLSGTEVLVTGTINNPTIVSGGYCGDGFCNPSSESHYSCPEDCVSCPEQWACTDWSSCINNQQTRTCTDSNNCGTTTNKPSEVKSCCIENWTCTDWGECDEYGTQRRTCTDSNNCGITTSRPAVSQSCISECGNGVCSGLEIFFDAGESIEFGGKVVTLENVAEGSVLVDVDGVKESINLTKSKMVNELSIKVEEVFYHTTKAQRQASLRFGENEYSCPEDCLEEEECVEDWTCADWSTCSNDQETRNCTDSNSCGTTVNNPAETRSCGCISEWKCEINPETCPPDGLQTKVCKDVACGSEDTREVIKCEPTSSKPEFEECNGCLLDGTCVSLGFRIEGNYCDLSKNFHPQKKTGESCDNNFECETNTCSKGVCIDLERELKESMGVIKKIWCKIAHPFSNERYISCLAG